MFRVVKLVNTVFAVSLCFLLFSTNINGQVYHREYKKSDLKNEVYKRGNKPVLEDGRIVFVETLEGVKPKEMYWRAHNILTNLMGTTGKRHSLFLNKFTLLQENERIQLDGGYEYWVKTTFYGLPSNPSIHTLTFKLLMEFKDGRYRMVFYDFKDFDDVSNATGPYYREHANLVFNTPDEDEKWDKFFDKNGFPNNKGTWKGSFMRMAFIDNLNYFHKTISEKMKSPIKRNSDTELIREDKW